MIIKTRLATYLGRLENSPIPIHVAKTTDDKIYEIVRGSENLVAGDGGFIRLRDGQWWFYRTISDAPAGEWTIKEEQE